MSHFSKIVFIAFIAITVSSADVYYDGQQKNLINVPNDIPNSVTHLLLRGNNITTFRTDSITNLKQLVHLDLAHNKLTFFPDLNPVAATIQTLILQYNGITSIAADLLNILTKLINLDLRRNSLSFIPNVSGPGMTLKHLILEQNRFTAMPDLHLIGHKVTFLDLSYNQISSVDYNKFRNMSALQKLRLNKTGITSFPNFTLVKDTIQNLRLYGNKIPSVSYQGINELRKLRYLDIRYNLLKEFPNAPGPASTLVYLYLGGNRFTHIPKYDVIGAKVQIFIVGKEINETKAEDFAWMSNIRHLYLSTNKLCEFPNFTLIADKLTYVSLAANCLHYIPPSHVNMLTSLESLNLGHNKLSSFPDLHGPGATLKYLYLHGNQFTSIPELNAIGSNLIYLNLNTNLLTDIYRANISSLQKLRTLHLHANKFVTFPHVGFLSSMEYLQLQSNMIATVPEENAKFTNITKLVTIILLHNQIEVLPPFFGPEGFSIDARNNPIICDNALIWAVRDPKVSMSLTCANPERIKGKSYKSISLRDLSATKIVEGNLENEDNLHDALENTCTEIKPVPVKFRTVCSPFPSDLILKLQGEFEVQKNFITRVTVTFTGSGCGSPYISVHASDQEPNSCRSTGTTDWRVKICDLIGQDENDFGALKCLYQCPMAKIMYINFNEYMSSNTKVCDIGFQKDTGIL